MGLSTSKHTFFYYNNDDLVVIGVYKKLNFDVIESVRKEWKAHGKPKLFHETQMTVPSYKVKEYLESIKKDSLTIPFMEQTWRGTVCKCIGWKNAIRVIKCVLYT